MFHSSFSQSADHNAQGVSPTSIDNHPIWPTPSSLFISFFQSLLIFWQHSFDNIFPMKYRIITEINFVFRRLHFYRQHRFGIWFKIIKISDIQRKWGKNIPCKWKTCILKSIIATKFIHCKWKAAFTLPSIENLLY